VSFGPLLPAVAVGTVGDHLLIAACRIHRRGTNRLVAERTSLAALVNVAVTSYPSRRDELCATTAPPFRTTSLTCTSTRRSSLAGPGGGREFVRPRSRTVLRRPESVALRC